MEKTLKELIIHIIDDEGNVSAQDVLKLLQQVREATIEECKLISDKYYFQNSRNIIRDISNIPTDRIKITE